MDQAVCMDHLNRCRKGSGFLPISAAHTTKFERHNWPQPLSACHETILHCFKQQLLRLVGQFLIVLLQIGFQVFPIFAALLFKVHPENPPPQGFRPVLS